MSFLNRKIDEFCARNRGFGIPNLIQYIVLGSALYYMFGPFLPIGLEFVPAWVIERFEIWRVFTYIFTITSDNVLIFILMLLFTYSIGQALERTWGTAKFNLFYLGSMVITVGVGFLVTALGLPHYFATGDFMHYSLLLAFALLYPEMEIRFMMVIPLKMKYLAVIDVIYIIVLVHRYVSLGAPAVAISLLAPLVVVMIFFWPDFLHLLKRGKHKTSKQTINFNTAQREAKKAKGYLHKCTVCGETDGTAPALEFRYCSKCNGYHCYCSNHINDHIHVE